MADQNYYSQNSPPSPQGQSSPAPQQGSGQVPRPGSGQAGGQPKVPPPPPPPITVRTMGSDIKSMQSSGGTPVPQQVKPAELKNFGSSADEPLFSPDKSPEQASLSKQSGGGMEWVKIIAWTLGIIIVLGGLGFVGYQYVYPLFFSDDSVDVAPPPDTTSQPPPPQTLVHSSFFITPATQSQSITITELTPSGIQSALSAIPSSGATPSLDEVVISDGNGQVSASDFVSSLVPALSQSDLSRNFEDDFTAFIYRDTNGDWPGYILKLQSDALLVDAQGVVENIETDVSSLSNLYLINPGSPKDAAKAFINGQLSGTQTRYLPFTAPGAALNYGILQNYLLISTSYPGIQEAAKLLGF